MDGHDEILRNFGGFIVTDAVLYFLEYASNIKYVAKCINDFPFSRQLGMPFMELIISIWDSRPPAYFQLFYDRGLISVKIQCGSYITEKIPVSRYSSESRKFHCGEIYDYKNNMFLPKAAVIELEKIEAIILEKIHK